MNDLNPLDKKEVDALNGTVEGGFGQNDILGGSEQVKQNDVSRDQLTRYAGNMAVDLARNAKSEPQQREVNRYRGIEKVLRALPPEQNMSGDAMVDTLTKRMDSLSRRGALGSTDEEASRLAASMRAEIQALRDAIDFVGNATRSKDFFEKDLKKLDEAANTRTPATSGDLKTYADLLAQEFHTRDAAATAKGEKDSAYKLGGNALHYEDIRDDLATAVHENGVPFTYDQTIAYYDDLIASLHTQLNREYDNERRMDLEDEIGRLEQVQNFVFESVSPSDDKERFQQKITDQHTRVDTLKGQSLKQQQEESHRQDAQELKEVRDELLPDEENPATAQYWRKYIKPLNARELPFDAFKKAFASGGQEKYRTYLRSLIEYKIQNPPPEGATNRDTVAGVCGMGSEAIILQRAMAAKGDAMLSWPELAVMPFSEYAKQYLDMEMPPGYETAFLPRE